MMSVNEEVLNEELFKYFPGSTYLMTLIDSKYHDAYLRMENLYLFPSFWNSIDVYWLETS